MTAPKDGQYVSIQAFMVSEYGLKGNELIIYAVIYGYSQDGEHWYYGSKAHLAAWCGASKNTVGNCIKSLIEKGLVERRENEERGQVRVEYRISPYRSSLKSPFLTLISKNLSSTSPSPNEV